MAETNPNSPRPAPATDAKRVPLAEELPEASPEPIARPRVPRSAGHSRHLDTEDLTRRMTAANIQYRRGQTDLARQQIEEALAEFPQSASVHELYGDILQSLSRNTEAAEAYEAAIRLEPGRVTAEAKLARLTLKDNEDRTRAKVGVAYAGAERPVFATQTAAGAGGRFSPAIASAVIPGLGQVLRGEYVKGGVLAVVYVATILIWASLPDARQMLSSALHVRGSIPAGPGIGTVIASLVGFGVWLYAILDAKRAPAAQTGDTGSSRR